MSADTLTARLELARHLAHESGALLLSHFNHRRIAASDKADGSPVTAADLAAEQCIHAGIVDRFPDDAILGEEQGETAGTSGFRWVVDPIDGTVSFMHGVPVFGTLIGIERDETPVAGVMHFPGLDESAWACEGGGAWHAVGTASPRRVTVSACDTMTSAMICTTSFDYYRNRALEPAFNALGHASGRTRGWSDCHSHLLLVTGRIDAVVEPELKPWDCSAIIAVLREAGGTWTDWAGDREDASSVDKAIASNGHIHDELVTLLGPWADAR